MAQSLVGFYAGIISFRGLDRLPGVSGPQVMAERRLILLGIPMELVGIPRIVFVCFTITFEPEMLESPSNPQKTRIEA